MSWLTSSGCSAAPSPEAFFGGMTKVTVCRRWSNEFTGGGRQCWGLVLKCYESRTRQHKILIVGTLKLGYPLLLYKVAVPTRLSLSRVVKVLRVGPGHGLPQSRATTLGPQQRPTPPHGRVRSRHVSREGDIHQGINGESEPPWESAGPLDIQSGPPRLV
jgi:hypothetical protein